MSNRAGMSLAGEITWPGREKDQKLSFSGEMRR